MKKSVLYLLHSIILMLVAYISISAAQGIAEHYNEPLYKCLIDTFLFHGSLLGLFYLAYWIFLPKYLIRKQYIKFTLGFLGILIGFTLYFNLSGIIIRELLNLKFHLFVRVWWTGVAAWTLAIGIFGTTFRMLIEYIKEAQEKSELEKQNFKSEVSLLKNQLNPHFLFNTLNNIDSLITENQENASLALNKLSEIMRYMVYDSEKEMVPLEDEINYIKNYISLQKLRIKNEDIITFDIIGDTNGKVIAPMIFISFVENAFKHSSLKDREENKIKIKFELKDNLISFHCSNKIADIEKDKSSGVGLELVKKRLNLIYKNQHDININSSNGIFKVDLDIKIT